MNVSFKYGKKEKLDSLAIENGSINVTTDTEELFVDLEDKRIPLTKPVSTVLVSENKLNDMSNIKVWFKINTPPKFIIDNNPSNIVGGTLDSSNSIIITDKGSNNIQLGVSNENGETPKKDDLELICPEGVTGTIDENGKVDLVLPPSRYDKEYPIIIKNNTTGQELEFTVKYTAPDQPDFTADSIKLIGTNTGSTTIVNTDNSKVYGEDFTIETGNNVEATVDENGNINITMTVEDPDQGQFSSIKVIRQDGKEITIPITYEPKRPELSSTDLTISKGATSGVITVTNSDGSTVDMDKLNISGLPSGATAVKGTNGQITINVPSSWTTNQNFNVAISNEYSSTVSSVTYIPPSRITTSNSTLTLNETTSGIINIRNVDGSAVDMSKITVSGLPSGVTATKGTNGNITIKTPEWTTDQTFTFTVSNGVNNLTFTGKYTAPVQSGEKQPDLTLSRGRLWMDRAYAGGKVFLAGGTSNGSTKLNSVDIIDSSLTRTTGTNLDWSADQICGTWNANYAIFAGGFLGSAGSWGSSDKVNAYNSSNAKTTASSLDATTSSLMGARCGKTGQYALLVDSDNGYLYNGSLSKSTTTASAADGGQNGGYGATIGNYAIVGTYGSGKMSAYNASGSKTSVSDLTGSNFPCAAENDSYACFISGNNINRYNASLVKSTSTFGTSANQGHAIAGRGSNFIVTGGANTSGTTFNYAHLINASGVASILDSLTSDRWNHQGATVGNYAIFAGGCSGTGTVSGYSSCEVYTI